MTIFYFLMALYSNNFFWFLFLFIEFYFFYYTSRLIHYLNSVDQDIIESLRSGWNQMKLHISIINNYFFQFLYSIYNIVRL